MKLFMMPHATDQEIDGLLVHYPDDLRPGCPFDTGIKNALGMVSFEEQKPKLTLTIRSTIQACRCPSG